MSLLIRYPCPSKVYRRMFLYTRRLRAFLFTLKLSWILKIRSDIHACANVFRLTVSLLLKGCWRLNPIYGLALCWWFLIIVGGGWTTNEWVLHCTDLNKLDCTYKHGGRHSAEQFNLLYSALVVTIFRHFTENIETVIKIPSQIHNWKDSYEKRRWIKISFYSKNLINGKFFWKFRNQFSPRLSFRWPNAKRGDWGLVMWIYSRARPWLLSATEYR
jgi:hypothetical protein